MTRRRSRRGPISAEDLFAELEADDDYQEAIRKQDEVLERKAAEWRRAEAPLVEDLRAAGLEVESSWDLVNTSTPYPAALPILLEHLDRPYPDRVREGIARALAVRDAQFGIGELIRLYRAEPVGTNAKDGLAAAIGGSAGDDLIDDVIDLATDPSNGTNRVLMLDAIARSSAPQAQAALKKIVREDSSIGDEARTLLRRSRRKR